MTKKQRKIMGNNWVVMCLDRVNRVDTFEDLSSFFF